MRARQRARNLAIRVSCGGWFWGNRRVVEGASPAVSWADSLTVVVVDVLPSCWCWTFAPQARRWKNSRLEGGQQRGLPDQAAGQQGALQAVSWGHSLCVGAVDVMRSCWGREGSITGLHSPPRTLILRGGGGEVFGGEVCLAGALQAVSCGHSLCFSTCVSFSDVRICSIILLGSWLQAGVA